MNSRRSRCSLQSTLLLFILGLACISTQAGMIGTEKMVPSKDVAADKHLIYSSLAREDVKQALLRHGVHPQDVQQRIDQLTDTETRQLADQFESLPAAGGLPVILLMPGPIMLLMEMMGTTDLTTAF